METETITNWQHLVGFVNYASGPILMAVAAGIVLYLILKAIHMAGYRTGEVNGTRAVLDISNREYRRMKRSDR